MQRENDDKGTPTRAGRRLLLAAEIKAALSLAGNWSAPMSKGEAIAVKAIEDEAEWDEMMEASEKVRKT